MANTHATLCALFTAIADAIRGKTGKTEPLVADRFPAEISDIQAGMDTSDADALASDILRGKTAYVAGVKVTGTLSKDKYFAAQTDRILTLNGAGLASQSDGIVTLREE